MQGWACTDFLLLLLQTASKKIPLLLGSNNDILA